MTDPASLRRYDPGMADRYAERLMEAGTRRGRLQASRRPIQTLFQGEPTPGEGQRRILPQPWDWRTRDRFNAAASMQGRMSKGGGRA